MTELSWKARREGGIRIILMREGRKRSDQLYVYRGGREREGGREGVEAAVSERENERE